VAFHRSLTAAEHRRAILLRRTRGQATGLLIAVTLVFAGVTAALAATSPGYRWLSWIQATAVGSMAGGLADWFAVTALFRRPLGLPIPHTAIVVERKDRFAETLGSFVQESFLTPEAVSERIRAANAIPRIAEWLAQPQHAEQVAARAASVIRSASEVLRDEDVHEVLDALVRQRVDQVALAPLAGRVLDELTRAGRHEPLIDALLDSLSLYLRRHGAELHQRLGVYSPWWLPGPIGNRMVGRLLLRTQVVIDEMARNRNHPLRHQLDTGLVKVAQDLQSSAEMRERGEKLKSELVSQPQIRDFAAAVWRDVKEQIADQTEDPQSELHARIARLVMQTGERLQRDPTLQRAAERSLDSAARLVLTSYEGELIALVSGTISRWDAQETSRRLELLLGPDLQYIRINGTVVGALAGLALHALATV
jgi:uncharacterized membrane-anchored protein YjiN (DUF445 family)